MWIQASKILHGSTDHFLCTEETGEVITGDRYSREPFTIHIVNDTTSYTLKSVMRSVHYLAKNIESHPPGQKDKVLGWVLLYN